MDVETSIFPIKRCLKLCWLIRVTSTHHTVLDTSRVQQISWSFCTSKAHCKLYAIFKRPLLELDPSLHHLPVDPKRQTVFRVWRRNWGGAPAGTGTIHRSPGRYTRVLGPTVRRHNKGGAAGLANEQLGLISELLAVVEMLPIAIL